MSGPRRCGGRRPPAVVGDNGNGYVETDPTGRYGRVCTTVSLHSHWQTRKVLDFLLLIWRININHICLNEQPDILVR
ncbi:hypothetical protein HU200_030507 [Digitaria exilis]|uniref:Uncharacterized protein n=1 Tax=Digitaria exilis TaxID=1010633 RepID=A0A835EQZ5_9POAL|nr:hypothetical protein HU200_030507 [Digitaria exilis]